MPDAAAPALTAPAPVIDALLAGEQVIDLRLPGAGGPPEDVTRFWLQVDPGVAPELKAAYRRARELSLPDPRASAGQGRVEGWAELVGRATTRLDDATRAALDGKTILALEPLAGQEVLVLGLRVHRLVEPAADTLNGLPADPAQGPPSEPALSEAAFRARYDGVANAVPGGLPPPD